MVPKRRTEVSTRRMFLRTPQRVIIKPEVFPIRKTEAPFNKNATTAFNSRTPIPAW